MKKQLLITLAALILPIAGIAATFCEPMIFLQGKSKGEHSELAYIYQNTGECEWHVLYKLHFTGSGLDSVQSIRYGGLNEVFACGPRISPEAAVRLTHDSSGEFRFPNTSFGITESTPDSTRMAQIDSIFVAMSRGGAVPKSWTAKPGGERADSAWFIQNPASHMFGPLELLYYNPDGLYMDYQIRDAVFFRASRLLWIETFQPRRLMGGDMAHGVLIYRVLNK
jgi:hypothetical protein